MVSSFTWNYLVRLFDLVASLALNLTPKFEDEKQINLVLWQQTVLHVSITFQKERSFYMLGLSALRTHLLFKLWTCSLCVNCAHCKTKQKSSRVLTKKFVDFESLKNLNWIWMEANFWNFDHSQNLGLVGLAVLTFIGYKQTNKHPNNQTPWQTDKQISLSRSE